MNTNDKILTLVIFVFYFLNVKICTAKYLMHRLTKNKKIAIALVASLNINCKKRKIWSKKWLLDRKKFSDILLLKQLDSDDFRNYLRMDHKCFNILLNLVSPIITKQNTNMRNAVTAEERLIVTLRYLATGREYADLRFSSAISPQLLSKIIPETCKAIYKVLKKYIQVIYTATFSKYLCIL